MDWAMRSGPLASSRSSPVTLAASRKHTARTTINTFASADVVKGDVPGGTDLAALQHIATALAKDPQ
jgi:hypothetical protein